MSNLREQLSHIYSQRGRLTPDIVVQEATPESSPLHHRFEWNDAVAGHEFRKVQAADLIRSVRVTYTEPKTNENRSVRAFVALRPDSSTTDTRPSYEPIEKVLENPDSRELLLKQCRTEWASFERRYKDLEEFDLIVGRAPRTA